MRVTQIKTMRRLPSVSLMRKVRQFNHQSSLPSNWSKRWIPNLHWYQCNVPNQTWAEVSSQTIQSESQITTSSSKMHLIWKHTYLKFRKSNQRRWLTVWSKKLFTWATSSRLLRHPVQRRIILPHHCWQPFALWWRQTSLNHFSNNSRIVRFLINQNLPSTRLTSPKRPTCDFNSKSKTIPSYQSPAQPVHIRFKASSDQVRQNL